MCPARNHVNCFYFIAGNFKFNCFSCVYVSLLNQTMTVNYNKQFPLAVMPVLSFCNAGLADIDTNLSAVLCVNKFCEAASVINIHFHGILKLLFLDGKRSKVGEKYLIQPKDSHTTMLAGLYRFEERNGLQVPVFSVLTRDAVGELRGIHERMPMILQRKDIGEWIKPNGSKGKKFRVFPSGVKNGIMES